MISRSSISSTVPASKSRWILIGVGRPCTAMGGSCRRTYFRPCACRKLDPAILVVKPAEDGLSSELAEPLHLSTGGGEGPCHASVDRCVGDREPSLLRCRKTTPS